MSGINLNDEYGSLLDSLDKFLGEMNSDTLAQHGVKGMHWGQRKDDSGSGRSALKSLGPDSVTRKTASGETVTMSKTPPNALNKFLGRISKNYRASYANSASLVIKDSLGKQVGEAQVTKKSADELNLVWLGIHKSSRGQGYATAVMHAGAEFGRQSGFKKMTLEVPGNSPDARHIYEKLGFKVVKEDLDGEDPVWGGLTSMEYDFDKIKHHGVKGMHWGVRHLETAHLQRKSAKLQKNSDHLHRLASNHPQGTKEKIQRAALDISNLGARSVTTRNLEAVAANVDTQHRKVLARLDTPEAQRRMTNATKAKIAVGGLVAARILYVAGGLAVNTLVANKFAANNAVGAKALESTAAALNFAKKSKGVYKITSAK